MTGIPDDSTAPNSYATGAFNADWSDTPDTQELNDRVPTGDGWFPGGEPSLG